MGDFTKEIKKDCLAWQEYCNSGWIASGKLEQVDPKLIFADPIIHNQNSYKWFENKYGLIFKEILTRVQPNSNAILKNGKLFADHWELYYEPITLWKQIRPFLAFSELLGGITETHINLATAYILGQGIPSMVVDWSLDNRFDTPKDQDSWLFTITALAHSLELIRKNDKTGQLENIFLYYVNQMYRLMWDDKKSRYSNLENDAKQQLNSYLNDDSRLLSSVFFGITIEWAYAISGTPISDKIGKTTIHLRKIRQLNDEIVDVDEDIQMGILTYPYLFGLTTKRFKKQLTSNITKTWQTSNDDEIRKLNYERRYILRESGAFYSSAKQSYQLIKQCMNNIMSTIPAKKAFDITLILNQRLTLLLRLAQNDWNEIDYIYQPNPVTKHDGSRSLVTIKKARK